MARARGWLPAVAVWAGALAVSWTFSGVAFDVPFAARKIPIIWLMVVIVEAAVLYPLADHWQGQSRTFVRERRVRALSVLFAAVLALTIAAPATAAHETVGELSVGTALFAVGVLAVTLVGEYAWGLVPLAGLSAEVFNNLNRGVPLAYMDHVHWWGVGVSSAMVLAAMVVYVVRGPRSTSS